MSADDRILSNGEARSTNQTRPRNNERWKELAQMVATETDPDRMMKLVAELIAERDRVLKNRH